MRIAENKIMHLLSIAKEAAVLAGTYLSKHDRATIKLNKDSGRDIKISADIDSERIILDFLRKKTDFSILSEEKGLLEGSDRSLTWIVDPLDGSFNYLRGVPVSCVSVGLWKGKSPLAGVVYDFNRSELFSGLAGKEAHLNGKPIRVSTTGKKEKGVLSTGFPSNTDSSPKGIKEFIKNAQAYKKMRLLGSAALSIAYVACGRTDAYSEKDIMLWDVAGAIPILAGAGGKFNMERTGKIHSFYVFASNGKI